MHSLHALAEPVEMNPLAQAEHVDAPAAKPVKEPARHVVQDVSPTVGANEPSAQDSHATPLVAFTMALTLPASHGTHTLWSGDAKEPVAHCEQVLDPCAAAQPAGHATHVSTEAAPSTGLAVPATHATHWDWLADAKVPALQRVQSSEAAGVTNPWRQAVHVVEPVTKPLNSSWITEGPVKCPSPHVWHADCAGEDANDPEGHGAQVETFTAPTVLLAVPATHATH
jgi:hypothetical protein